MRIKWTRVNSKWTRGGLRLQYKCAASGPEWTRSGLGVDSVYNTIPPQVDPSGLEVDFGFHPFTLQFTLQFRPKWTRTPFSIYNNKGGWAVSPPGQPQNIVLGPRCSKRGWYNKLLLQF